MNGQEAWNDNVKASLRVVLAKPKVYREVMVAKKLLDCARSDNQLFHSLTWVKVYWEV